MQTSLRSVGSFSPTDHLLILADEGHFEWAETFFHDLLTEPEIRFLKQSAAQNITCVTIPHPERLITVQFLKACDNEHIRREKARKVGVEILKTLLHFKIEAVTVLNRCGLNMTMQVVEGMVLGNYQFLKYATKAADRASSLKNIAVHTEALDEKMCKELHTLCVAVCKARDLVNEPSNFLTAEQLSQEFAAMGKEAGFSVEILEKKQIENLKMGGLIAVNKGSVQPPTFTIMEWKPKKARNKRPIVLVGKGVVYDTGGLSLKPTTKSMDYMKCDMGGSAVVGCVMYMVAKMKLDLHIIALVPATDNRPGGDAFAPGDILTMFDGTTVEQMNSDAEGRLILADALAFAKKYKPELVCDFATLTGSAAAAIGNQGIVYMGTANEDIKWQMEASGFASYERLVEFPLWDEYAEWLKSDIADMKSLGQPEAGMITAGKFLQHFTDYPWLHFDIAGSAFAHAPEGYKVKGGTGVGIRLMWNFLKYYGK
jgi:leucyl aminopeptidase